MDRRQHGRFDLEAPLRFSWKGPGDVRHRAEGRIRNISVGGVFVFTDDPPPVGARVRFCVYFRSFLARSRLVMQTTAQVVRVEPSPQGTAPAGFAAALKTYMLRNEAEVVEREGF
jgi:PilZ domain